MEFLQSLVDSTGTPSDEAATPKVRNSPVGKHIKIDSKHLADGAM